MKIEPSSTLELIFLRFLAEVVMVRAETKSLITTSKSIPMIRLARGEVLRKVVKKELV